MKGNSTRNDPVIIWYCPVDLNQQASLSDLSFYNLFSGVWWMTIEYTVPVESLGVDPLPQHHFQLNCTIPKLIEAFTHNSKTTETKTRRFSTRGGGGTAIYRLCRYMPLWRVWFSSGLLWDRVYNSESLGLEEGIIFHLNWSIGWRF